MTLSAYSLFQSQCIKTYSVVSRLMLSTAVHFTTVKTQQHLNHNNHFSNLAVSSAYKITLT